MTWFFLRKKVKLDESCPRNEDFQELCKIRPEKFCEDLRGVNWVDSTNSSGTANENVICVDKLWLNFKSAFLKVADRHAPLIQKRVRGVDNCPWMTGQIKKRHSMAKTGLRINLLRNRVTNSVKRAKQTYNKKLIDNNKDDTKAFWRTMKKIIPGNKSSGGSKNVNIDGVLCSDVSDRKKIANGFNNFFASAAVRLKRALGSFSFLK